MIKSHPRTYETTGARSGLEQNVNRIPDICGVLVISVHPRERRDMRVPAPIRCCSAAHPMALLTEHRTRKPETYPHAPFLVGQHALEPPCAVHPRARAHIHARTRVHMRTPAYNTTARTNLRTHFDATVLDTSLCVHDRPAPLAAHGPYAFELCVVPTG